LKLIVTARIYHILIYRKNIIDLKTGFLRIFFWTFIEVKRTIPFGSINIFFTNVHSLLFFTIYIYVFKWDKYLLFITPLFVRPS
jgi:hypothetical protein